MSPHKGYMNIAIAAMLFAAAFAGVVFIADENVAAAEESQSQAQEYTVTYSYDGSIVSEKISTNYKVKALGEVMPTAEAPEARTFDYWVSGSAIFKAGASLDVAGDITLTPVFKADRAIVKLVYGDVVKEFFPPTSAAAAAAAAKDSGSEDSYLQKYPISYSSAKGLDVKDTKLAEFAEAIGATYTTTTNDKSKTVAIDKLVLDGFEFKGFVDKDGKSVGFDGLIATATATKQNSSDTVWTLGSAEPAVYTAVFEPIYNVTFVADGLTISKQTTEQKEITEPDVPSKEHYTSIGWFDKDGNKFDPAFKAYTADVTYTAKYAPLTYKVYFMNGETVVAERSSEYMGQIDLPDLPDGFVSWADKDGNVVGSPVTITGPDMKFYAVAGIVKCSVAFVNGEQTVATVEVIKGEKIAADDIPALPEGVEKWDFDFETPITENITVKAVAKVYDVTFDFGVMYAAMNVTIQVEHGQVIPADKVPVIPEEFPEKDKRWNYDPAAPVESDMTIQLRDNIYFEVVFVAGETEVAKVSVLEGTAVPADKVPAIPEGYKEWAFDVAAPVTADMTVEAVAKEVVFNVTFEIEGKADVTQKSDSMTLPVTDREGYVFQGWVVKGQTQYVDPMTYAITEDITFVAVYKEADAPAGPDFIDTNEGKCVLILIGVALVAFAYAVYTNMFGLKDKLTSVKLVRVKKE